MTPEQLIEAILFSQPEPVAVKDLSRLIKKSPEETVGALENLATSLAGRGIVLVQTENEVALATHPDASDTLKAIRQEELQKDLGRAGLETIGAVIYAGPLTKGRVDYLRGVNSGFILRHLMVRGLVERIPNPDDSRSFLYRPTLELLSYLGVSQVEELPDYETVRHELDNKVETINPNDDTATT